MINNIWFLLFIYAIGSNADPELSILHSPDSLEFTGYDPVYQSHLKDVYAAALGLSVAENSKWTGLSVVDPFNTPKAILEIYVDVVPSSGISDYFKSQNYPLVLDTYEPDSLPALRQQIQQRLLGGGFSLIGLNNLEDTNKYFDVSDSKRRSDVKKPLKHLNPSVEEDGQFLKEIQALEDITEQVNKKSAPIKDVIDFYTIRVKALHALCDYYGAYSLQSEEAQQMLGSTIQDLSNAFVKAYENSILVVVVSSDNVHTRRTLRSVSEEQTANITDLRLADDVDPEYAATFNLILWFSVTIVFSLVAVIYALMTMDPGRDSIIYRMTSTRMKKDN